jgi:uncharacterized protein with PQ loop repeat
MDIVDVVGIIALIITIIYMGYGLPVQIYKNFKAKSTKNLSLSMVILLLLTLTTWVIYGFVKIPTDWYIVISNSIGVISSLVILSQFWIYRANSLRQRD